MTIAVAMAESKEKKPSITQSQASVAVNVALSKNRVATCKPMIECQAHVA